LHSVEYAPKIDLQIGRPEWVNFRLLCDHFFHRSKSNIGATFLQDKIYLVILTKMAWITFWAIFSQTHLVALPTKEAKKYFIASNHFYDRQNTGNIFSSKIINIKSYRGFCFFFGLHSFDF
jgi:hypothetical protein